MNVPRTITNKTTGEMVDNDPGTHRFRKIKIHKDQAKVELHYELLTRDINWDEYKMVCNQRARPQLYDRMNDLVAEVTEMLDLPEMYRQGMKVSSVSLSYAGEDEVMGAVITAQKSLLGFNSPVILNTPYAPSEPMIDGDDMCLPESTTKAIEALCREAWKYRCGDREQTNLFAGNDDDVSDGPPKTEEERRRHGNKLLGQLQVVKDEYEQKRPEIAAARRDALGEGAAK